jgi:DNA-binding CsgD family transcriptional regulator/PAS domain-containing protein
MAEAEIPCSLEDFSATVEAVYDAVVEPERWKEAVRRIAALCTSPVASVGVYDFANGDNVKMFDHGYSPEFWMKYQPYAQEHPILSTAGLLPVGAVTTIALSCGDEEYFGSRIYREVFQPAGYCDFIGLLALRTGSRVGYLHACRTIDQPRYADMQVRIFNLLSKHVCRAMQISDLFNLSTIRSQALEQTLEALAAGVFLIARDGRVVHMNGVARSQVQSARALRLAGNRISAIDPDAARALASTMARVVDDEAETVAGQHAIALPGRDGSGFIATILPLGRGRRQDFSKPFAAVAAIFVQNPVAPPIFPGEAFAKLYGLTGGELRVALAMAPGLQPQAIADVLGIGLQTVKTHLQRIFQKTGTSRQVDLVALMSRAAGPTRLG